MVFASAAVLYLVGSHWPRLEMEPVGDGPGPSPDKFLHFIAFLLLALPAWWTGWFRGLGMLWLAGLGFAVFDEVTQWLLPIERDLTVEDLLCDACGVTAAVAVLAASRPMGDPQSRRVASQRRIAEATLLSKPSNWLVLAATSALGIVVLVPVAVLASGPLRIEARAMAVAGAAIGAAIAGLVALEFGIGAAVGRLRASGACLRCGEGGPEERCAGCGATRHGNDWSRPPRPPLGVWFDAAWWPMARAGLAATAVLVALGWVGEPWRRSPDHATVGRVLDLTVLFAAAAWAVHGARRRRSRILAAADRRCIACGHDLRGRPAGESVARCPECGTPMPPRDASGAADAAVAGSTAGADGRTMSP